MQIAVPFEPVAEVLAYYCMRQGLPLQNKCYSSRRQPSLSVLAHGLFHGAGKGMLVPQTGLFWLKQVHYKETQDRYGELTTPSVLANCMIWVEKVSCLAVASLSAGLCKHAVVLRVAGNRQLLVQRRVLNCRLEI